LAKRIQLRIRRRGHAPIPTAPHRTAVTNYRPVKAIMSQPNMSTRQDLRNSAKDLTVKYFRTSIGYLSYTSRLRAAGSFDPYSNPVKVYYHLLLKKLRHKISVLVIIHIGNK
jgi:hypothetical protein